MQKSVFTIETPERCEDCPCIGCKLAGKINSDYHVKIIPDWCPLMDLPEKDNGDYPANTVDAGFAEGWNQCIDEITGGDSDD